MINVYITKEIRTEAKVYSKLVDLVVSRSTLDPNLIEFRDDNTDKELFNIDIEALKQIVESISKEL